MTLLQGDCLEVLKSLPDNSVDSLVTDPPAGISFMGKAWDDDKGGRKEWCAWMESVMRECLRVLKPGAHGLVWAIPRTSHWTAVALEDAGFEVRDCVTHLFGSGFPKSLDISKAIDKAAGQSRESAYKPNFKNNDYGRGMGGGEWNAPSEPPKTESAKEWQGWGTALKPAAEFWWLVRKPCSEKTVAKNVLKWGTGAINIDAGRIATEANPKNGVKNPGMRESESGFGGGMRTGYHTQGRFPANLVLSHSPNCTEDACDMFECAIAALDRQAGDCPSATNKKPTKSGGIWGVGAISQFENGAPYAGERGGPSRFFYCAKISSSERNAGLEGFAEKELATSTGQTRPGAPARLGSNPDGKQLAKNTHPTVKPKKLMAYLIKLITPPNGTVLDPFMGSGSTGIAAKEQGFKFIGIEREEEYFEIAKARVNA